MIQEKVALKMEKSDKSKRILMFEYDILKTLQGNRKFFIWNISDQTISIDIGLNHTVPVFEFVERSHG